VFSLHSRLAKNAFPRRFRLTTSRFPDVFG
jgi:hypothetical protein